MKSLGLSFSFSMLTAIPYLMIFSSHVQSYSFKHITQQNSISQTIVVDQSGHGNFRTVQQAVDSIPPYNKYWICIQIKNGVYNEKVVIPKDKQRIYMKGEDVSKTIIQFGDSGSVIESATFKLSAENFIAVGITFKNTSPTNENPKTVTWAPAVLLEGDKAVFHDCSFISVQDTITDSLGRHYFDQCRIEGDVDFIWGSGQSVYHKCVLKFAGKMKPVFITAQARQRREDTSGFVFASCTIEGSGDAYLGRAYTKYSRVLYHDTFMPQAIVPTGWSAWEQKGQEGTIMFAEGNCKGPGANMGKRVRWEKSLTDADIAPLRNPKTFIDQDGWLSSIPISTSLPGPL